MLAVAGALAGATAAYAHFTSTGTGSGTASTGTLSVTVGTAGTTTTPLFPSGTGDVTLKVNNPNNVAVKVTAITGNGTITPDGGHASCSPTGMTFTNQTGLSLTIPANTTNFVIDSTNVPSLGTAASMSTASANSCQGATFTIPVSIEVQTP
jgi:hypothetical protein